MMTCIYTKVKRQFAFMLCVRMRIKLKKPIEGKVKVASKLNV